MDEPYEAIGLTHIDHARSGVTSDVRAELPDWRTDGRCRAEPDIEQRALAIAVGRDGGLRLRHPERYHWRASTDVFDHLCPSARGPRLLGLAIVGDPTLAPDTLLLADREPNTWFG
jgi:hypothetical protein